MNRLAHEASPYLRQHADNPVDWYPWGADAFEAARAADRPVLLSIGYSACHWCHVMAHESFEDPATAEMMNRLFVNVKVDREERPDVDAIYMEATQATTGHGGWPMTVFMTPDGEPFHCGTYFPKVRRGSMTSFTELMAAVDDAWTNRRADLTDQAQRLTEHVRREPSLDAGDDLPGLDAVDTAEQALLSNHDSRWGGFGRAPKFPGSMSIDLLLRQHLRTGAAASFTAAIRSLDAMAAGGIYDHLGGGFARYSVDDRWLVPHFEKMLYDNALLIRPYLHAWQRTGDERHRQVVDETISYVLRDLCHSDGGFYSAEDADSPTPGGHNEEGYFSTWTVEEMTDVLGPDGAADAARWFGVTSGGNFEGRNILFRPIGEIERPPAIESLRASLFEAREQRPRPGLDDKVLTEWNALMIASLAEAGAAARRPDWIEAAERAAEFLCAELRSPAGRWLRSWQEGSGARHLAYAHDHASLVDAFTRLYEATGRARWLAEATSTAEALIVLFADPVGGFFTTGSDAEQLITRPKDLMDNATPSANSTAAVSLLRLGSLTGDGDLIARAEQILRLLGRVARATPAAFGNLLHAVELGAVGPTEVVITGDRPDLVGEVTAAWRPHVVMSWGERIDGPLWDGRSDDQAYVCRDFTCRAPVGTAEALRAELEHVAEARR